MTKGGIQMSDLNFFEPFYRTKGLNAFVNLSFPQSLAPVIVLALLLPAMQAIQLMCLSHEISGLQEQLQENPSFQLFQTTADNKLLLAEAQQTLTLMQLSEEMIIEKEFITESLLSMIMEARPTEVIYHAFTISQHQVQIQGQSTDKTGVGHLERNLRTTGMFQHIFVPMMTKEENHWVFNLVFRVQKDRLHEDT